LPDEQLRMSLLASGWTPLGPLKYLTYVEIRWFVCDFESAPVDHHEATPGSSSGSCCKEHARHVGHLDIARELIDGQTGK
jgi:hypothetical protein